MRTYKYTEEMAMKTQAKTDEYLNTAVYLYADVVKAQEKYEQLLSHVTSCSVRCDHDRVQITHLTYDNGYAELVDASLEYDAALAKYKHARDKLSKELQTIFFTEDEWYVLHHRHLVPLSLSFEAIAKKHGEMWTRQKAWYLYTKAYLKVVKYLEQKEKTNRHVREYITATTTM